MVIAESPRTPTKLATEQTNAVVNIALMAQRSTTLVGGAPHVTPDIKHGRHRRVYCTSRVGQRHGRIFTFGPMRHENSRNRAADAMRARAAPRAMTQGFPSIKLKSGPC